MQQLQHRQQRHGRCDCHRAPAQRTAKPAGNQEHRRRDEGRQPALQREQYDLRDNTQRPQPCDQCAVKAVSVPLKRRETIINGVACLDEAGSRQPHDEGAIAEQAAARATRFGGWGRIDRKWGERGCNRCADQTRRYDQPNEMACENDVGGNAGDEAAQDEGSRAP